MLDRSWAIGLSQADFEREFLIHRPGADVIPDVSIWSKGSEPVYRHIDAPDPEKFVPEHIKEYQKKTYPCRKCGQAFEYPIARAGHEKACKVKETEETKDEL